MEKPTGRWLQAFGVPAFVCAMLAFGSGCGAIKAAANPKVAWAINDPAPMSVVVRRADVAEKTAQEVDRLMTETPANDDSAWVGAVGPDKDAATKDMEELRTHDLYAGGARVVAAEVWAKELSKLEPKGAAPSAPAQVAAAPSAPAAEESAPADEPEGKGKGKRGKGKRASKSAPADKRASKTAPVETKAEPAAATPAPTTAGNAKYSSLLSAIDPDLGAEWAKVMEKKKAIGEAKGQIAVLEAQNDEKGISDADKKANKAKISEIEKHLDALEDEAKKLSKAFVPKAKASAAKASPEVREKVGPAIVNLRQAVDDANVSNSAAALRYPMAASSLLDSAQQMAKIYVADVIEEKTGKRPSTQGLTPGVTMEGGKVAVTLNGLSQSDMGKLAVGEVTSEVASRTTAWVKRALGLLGTISATKEILELEDDVLAALLDGFKGAGFQAPAAVTIPDAPAPAGATPQS